MGKPGFLLPLMVVLLPPFWATLSAGSPNITTDQLALLALISHVTHDPQNLLATNWSAATSLCYWDGVTCGSKHQRVTSLNLSGMGLTGTIPPHLGNLSFLARLDMTDNSFHGSLPVELANLHRLKVLSFHNNSFSGEVPSWFGSFTQLQCLVLSENNFTGVIPSTLGNLSKLEELILVGNGLKGQIPTAVGNLASLKYLSLEFNQLSGEIPTDIGNLTSLESLDLYDNNLIGSVPSSIFNLSSLKEFVLGENYLSVHLSSDLFDNLPRLQYLELSGCQLSGRIPTSLFKCKELQFIALEDSQLEGTLPLEIRYMTSLLYFYVDYNSFVGPIPTLPPSLVGFTAGSNFLDGEIPSSICNLSSIEFLHLYDNNLGGIIPKCFGNSSLSLWELILDMNNLRGQIPESLFPQSCLLRSLRINNNQIEGPMPRSLVNCEDMEFLDLGNNKINDTFPSWLGSLKNLVILDLRSNRLYGHITNPDVAPSFSHLRIIDLSNNYFSGSLPSMFFENLPAMINRPQKKAEAEDTWRYRDFLVLTIKGFERMFDRIVPNFIVIDLSNNQFNKEIPEILGELSSLTVLNLSHNSLTGPIPSSFGSLSNLESLDLSSNKLQGKIPQQLVNLDFLQVLNLSCNNLTGLIPQGNHFDTFGNDSFSGNSGLCGFPLSKGCDCSDQDLEPPPAPSKFDDTSRELNWKFSILMGYGCGTVLGLSVGYIVFTTKRPQWFIQIIDRVQHKYIGTKIRRSGGKK